MSAYKFKKDDFDKVEVFFVYATVCEYHGTIATYELIDYENTVYKEIDLIDSTLIDGVLTLISTRPFDGQVVVMNANTIQS